MIFLKSFFSKNGIYLQYIFVSPFKKFNSAKKKYFLCKKIHSLKQTHSVKHEFYFQFSFATNEQV